MKHKRVNAACGAIVNAKKNETQLIVAGGGGQSSEVLVIRDQNSSNQWREGPKLPREFYMGGSLQDSRNGDWMLVGGSDSQGLKYYADMIRYDKEVEIFEFLPAKLKTRRSAFGALLAYVTDKC